MNKNIPDGCFVVGNKLMGKCYDCGKIIRIDKPILGSIHLCLLPEEIEERNREAMILGETWVEGIKDKHGRKN